jgi:hypothetical protein
LRECGGITADEEIYFGRAPDRIRREVENPYGRDDLATSVSGFLNRLRFGSGAGVEREYIEALEAEVVRLRAEIRRLASRPDGQQQD